MSNICSKCYYHEICAELRYDNVKTSYMQKIKRIKNRDGNTIIYVEKCKRFKNRKFKQPPKTKKCLKTIDKY